jgi:hypothetical protein
VIRGLVYLTGLVTLGLIGLVAAVAFRVDRWPWRNYAETGRQYLVDKLEDATYTEGPGAAPIAPPQDDLRGRPVEPDEPRPVVQPPVAMRHTVRRGETLYKIARLYYGVPEKWPLIAQANGIRSPADLRVGRVLVIPMWTTLQSADTRRLEPRLAITPAFDPVDEEAKP